jgi:hypothetical protein
MGFFDRLSDSKYRKVGESLASRSFTMCDHDQIQELLKECNFSPTESIRFKFDLFIVNSVVAAHAVNFSVFFDEEKAKKIIDPMTIMLNSYSEKIAPGSIRIGDFIFNNDECEFLRKNYQIDNPNIKTNCRSLLYMVYNYRVPKLYKAMSEGFNQFMSNPAGFWAQCHL